MMLGDGSKMPAHGHVETVLLEPMRGDSHSYLQPFTFDVV